MVEVADKVVAQQHVATTPGSSSRFRSRTQNQPASGKETAPPVDLPATKPDQPRPVKKVIKKPKPQVQASVPKKYRDRLSPA